VCAALLFGLAATSPRPERAEADHRKTAAPAATLGQDAPLPIARRIEMTTDTAMMRTKR
jgi:hypothetical protein